MVEAEKKLVTKEEKLKANEMELVAKVEELKEAQTEVGQLGRSSLGSVMRSHC